jgi:hypothetical protein
MSFKQSGKTNVRLGRLLVLPRLGVLPLELDRDLSSCDAEPFDSGIMIPIAKESLGDRLSPSSSSSDSASNGPDDGVTGVQEGSV